MDYDYGYEYGTGAGAAVAAFTAIMIAYLLFVLIIVVVAYVVQSIALMQLFKKVGISPGIAWVPYYNNWKWLELGGQKGWLSLLTLVGGGIVTSVFLYIGMYRTGLAFRKGTGFLVLGIFLPFVWCFMLGSRSAVYEPGLLALHGYPPPLAGYGAVPEGQRAPDEWYRQQAYAAQQQYAQQYGHPYPGTAGQPGYAQPGYAQPGTAQPGYPQPGYPQPGTPQPGTAQPGPAQPGPTQPPYSPQ